LPIRISSSFSVVADGIGHEEEEEDAIDDVDEHELLNQSLSAACGGKKAEPLTSDLIERSARYSSLEEWRGSVGRVSILLLAVLILVVLFMIMIMIKKNAIFLRYPNTVIVSTTAVSMLVVAIDIYVDNDIVSLMIVSY